VPIGVSTAVVGLWPVRQWVLTVPHRRGQTGSVTFIQRFNSGLALSPHFNLFALDGVFVDEYERGLRFVAVSEPSKLDVAGIVGAVHARVHQVLRHRRRLRRRGQQRAHRGIPRARGLLRALAHAPRRVRT